MSKNPHSRLASHKDDGSKRDYEYMFHETDGKPPYPGLKKRDSLPGFCFFEK